MLHAYSRLKSLLREQQLNVPELHRRMGGQGLHVNLKSLYHLGDDSRPLQRLDLRVAGAICEVLGLPLSDLISFEAPRTKLRRLGARKQRRLDVLMSRNNEGSWTGAEKLELRELVREAEELTLDNARRLAEQRQRLTTP